MLAAFASIQALKHSVVNTHDRSKKYKMYSVIWLDFPILLMLATNLLENKFFYLIQTILTNAWINQSETRNKWQTQYSNNRLGNLSWYIQTKIPSSGF